LHKDDIHFVAGSAVKSVSNKNQNAVEYDMIPTIEFVWLLYSTVVGTFVGESVSRSEIIGNNNRCITRCIEYDRHVVTANEDDIVIKVQIWLTTSRMVATNDKEK
jgi:hypothetical protein